MAQRKSSRRRTGRSARGRSRRSGWSRHLPSGRMLVLGAGLFLAGFALGVAGRFTFEPGSGEQEQVAQHDDARPSDTEAATSEPERTGDGGGERRGSAETSDGPAERAQTRDSAQTTAAAPDRLPQWRRHAAPIPAAGSDKPRVAIVLDDMGLSVDATRRAIGLPAPLTLSFLTYADTDDLGDLTAAAREAGHEVMAHVPMQAASESVNPGPHALTGAMSGDAIRANLTWGLDRLSGYVGINNHMGSALTADGTAMRRVMAELDDRGLLFLDSRTTAETRATQAADAAGVPYTERDVFLDNVRKPDAIREQLRELEALARRDGSAVAIGHPYEVTLSVLADWIPEARRRGIALIPISAAVDQAHRRNVAALPE